MGKFSYLSMKIDEVATDMIASDFKDVGHAAQELANHAIKRSGIGLANFILKWISSASAVDLLILYRGHWSNNIPIVLLVPYIFLGLPSILFYVIREVGKWITFIAVILFLFFSEYAPEWAVLPASSVLLIVVAPRLLEDTIRNGWIGSVICLLIGCFLLHRRIWASGGFIRCFRTRRRVLSTVGIIGLMVYPVWTFGVLFISSCRHLLFKHLVECLN